LRDDLLDALAPIKAVNNGPSPICSMVKFSTLTEEVLLQGRGASAVASARTSALIAEPGTGSINTLKLYSIVSNIVDPEIQIESTGNKLKISTQTAQAELLLNDDCEGIPSLEKPDNDPFLTLESNLLKELIAGVEHCIEKNKKIHSNL